MLGISASSGPEDPGTSGSVGFKQVCALTGCGNPWSLGRDGEDMIPVLFLVDQCI